MIHVIFPMEAVQCINLESLASTSFLLCCASVLAMLLKRSGEVAGSCGAIKVAYRGWRGGYAGREVLGNESRSLPVNGQHFTKISQAISGLVTRTFQHICAVISISVLSLELRNASS